MENIKNKDPDLAAALGSIRLHKNNMREDFEKAVAFLLPVCPYIKGKSDEKERKIPTVGAVVLKNVSESTTGVDFRWYTKPEYEKLTSEQKRELYQWQQTKDGKAQINKSRNNNNGNNSNNYNNNKNNNSYEKKTKRQLAAKIK